MIDGSEGGRRKNTIEMDVSEMEKNDEGEA